MFKRKLTALVLASVLLTLPFSLACSSKNITNNLQTVVSSAKDVLAAMSAADPAFAKVQTFVNDAQALLDAYKAAQTATQCVDLATQAANVVTAFQSAILPLLHVSPVIAAAVIGIDVALRIVATNFQHCTTTALNAPVGKIGAGNRAALNQANKTLTDYLNSPKAHK